jgi:hypothetical protein
MTWILLVFIIGSGTATTSVQFQTKEACVQASKFYEAQQNEFRVSVRTMCVGQEDHRYGSMLPGGH